MVTKKVYKNIIEYRNDKGQLHREDGPAREWSDGDKYWYINGQRHREDGPAVEYSVGNEKCFKWYLNDEWYSNEQDWQQEIIKIKLERLKNYGN
jgi:hypothetical protein